MPPRVTYWTGTWDPAKEAISKEVDVLRFGVRRRAPVVAFSPANATRLKWKSRAVTLSGRGWPLLRLAGAVIEPQGDISHVFGGGSSWHLLRALGRRPILLTAVASEHGLERLPIAKCAQVIVESAPSIERWLQVGVPRERVTLVRPGIDLDRYRPGAATPRNRFTLLFASTPADVGEIESRGIALLVELARARPDVDILVPWRIWGDVAQAQRHIEALRPPSNFLLRLGDIADMRDCYRRADATVVCFARGVGKTCPHFVLEGLASGLPCITTPESGLADLLRTRGGVLTDRSVTSLSHAVDRVQADYQPFSEQARGLAEDEFDLRRFRARYDEIYATLADARGC